MGYPMTYPRFVKRNQLEGSYVFDGIRYPTPHQAVESHRHSLAGDLRRLEDNQRDEAHLKAYAKLAGITVEQAKIVLDSFFDNDTAVENAVFELSYP